MRKNRDSRMALYVVRYFTDQEGLGNIWERAVQSDVKSLSRIYRSGHYTVGFLVF